MELFNFIFRLGVLFAIYGFIWGIIEIGVSLLRGSNQKTRQEAYVIKLVKYILLVDVTVLFSLKLNQYSYSYYHLTLSGLVLLIYFIGKLQHQQNQFAFIQNIQRRQGKLGGEKLQLKNEIILITLSSLVFLLLAFFPAYAENPISKWFHVSILNIEDTPIFGFIFRVIGFFFLVNILFKVVHAFVFLFSGKAFLNTSNNPDQRTNSKKNEDDYDDFEEIN
jgi:chorismate mutase